MELSHVLESDLWPNVPVYGFTVQADMGGLHSATDLSTGCTLTRLITLSTKRSFTHMPSHDLVVSPSTFFYSVDQIGLCNAIDLNNGLQIPKYWIIIPLEA